MTVRANKPAFSIREKLKELQKPIGLKGSELMRAETAQEAGALLGVGRKNWIINGNHTINQRGKLPVTGIGNFTYEVTDRWNCVNSSVVANASLSDNALKVTVTSATASSTFLGFKQIIEDKSFLDGKVVTLSALVRSNRSEAKICIFNGSIVTNYTSHSGNGQWERLVLTTVMPAGTEFSPVIVISGNPLLTAGTSFAVGDYIEFKEVQLELGKVATEFEHRSYGEELALCQRYYWIVPNARWLNGYKRNDSYVYFQLDTPVPMRASPTPTITNVGLFTNHQTALDGVVQTSGTSVFEYRPDSGRGTLQISSTYSGTHVWIPSWEGATIEFSAEL